MRTQTYITRKAMSYPQGPYYKYKNLANNATKLSQHDK